MFHDWADEKGANNNVFRYYKVVIQSFADKSTARVWERVNVSKFGLDL